MELKMFKIQKELPVEMKACILNNTIDY